MQCTSQFPSGGLCRREAAIQGTAGCLHEHVTTEALCAYCYTYHLCYGLSCAECADLGHVCIPVFKPA